MNGPARCGVLLARTAVRCFRTCRTIIALVLKQSKPLTLHFGLSQSPSQGGAWKHDLYGETNKEPSSRSNPSNRVQTGKSAKLQISNLHYEVSERELEVRE